MSGRIWSSMEFDADRTIECDVCIIGSGAGGGVLAEGLTARGLSVIMLEEGGLYTKADFDLQESSAFPKLYQERGGRATADLAISILQGRAVGGTTVVNWTTCYRTPKRILDLWASEYGIKGITPESMAPHFEHVERRLNIQQWPPEKMNANNRVIWTGCQKLGWEVAPLYRNVNGCADSGYCGLGCPVNGKQSMLVTTIPTAISQGMTLFADTRAERIEVSGDRVVSVHASVLDRQTSRPKGPKILIKPKIVSLSGGAINSPALLLRSEILDGPVGKRTFLHPVVGLAARYEHKINGFYGAPQAVASHQFIERGAGKVGFFMETPPVYPMLSALALGGFGAQRHELMSQLPYIGLLIALSVDGILPEDDGGVVSLRSDGRIRVDYPIRLFLQESFRESAKAMVQIAFAAGALEVSSLHLHPIRIQSLSQIEQFDLASWGALEHSIFTAHQMGGCAMGSDPSRSVVDSELRHHRIDNLFIIDGSVFPTALGVNPSQSIYGLAHRAIETVVSALGHSGK